MNSDEMLQNIEEAESVEDSQQEQQQYYKYLIFTIHNTPYALPAEAVREISLEDELHFVPFVPPYVRGIINRHGEPFAVIDVRVLFENLQTDIHSYLVLAHENRQSALGISDVREIKRVGESQIHEIKSSDDEYRFFTYSLSLEDERVFVLHVDAILKRLQDDVG